MLKMASKVYTKKGDKGYTLVMGTRVRVPKYHPRICAIGTVDELNSFVGLIRSNLTNRGYDATLSRVQKDLFNIGTGLADTRKEHNILLNIEVLERDMDIMSKSLQPLRNFILPAGNNAMCYCHVARTVCRRAEREIVKLGETEEGSVDDNILCYINRLSDYFFVLARAISKDTETMEVIWTQ